MDSVYGNLGPANYAGYSRQLTPTELNYNFYRNLILGMVLSLFLNFIGFYYFSTGDIKWSLYFAIAIPAGITFGGTFNTPRMYPDNWLMWQIYNVSKIVQCILLLNIANIFKYIFCPKN